MSRHSSARHDPSTYRLARDARLDHFSTQPSWGLTTITAPLHEMGKRAAHTVLGGYNTEDVVLPHRLAPRISTAQRS